MERAYEKLMRYAKVNTMSSDVSETMPSTERQFDLAKMLRDELVAMGASEVVLTDSCDVYAKIPATPGLESKPKVGFIAHVDTIPDFPGENVKPILHENYDGKDIALPLCGRVITVKDFPDLKNKVGKTILTASGDTLLGSDDKAGAAEIMVLCERLLNGSIPHGTVCVAFTPDEEVGRGTEAFDIPQFGADFAYTLDGGVVGEVVSENFNAASASVVVHGVNVHPGSAKDIMVNACLVAMEFNSLLPAGAIPAKTTGYEGFFHLTELEGNVERVKMHYILRDHDLAKLREKEQVFRTAVEAINGRYGAGTVEANVKESYRNMREELDKHPEVVEIAMKATELCGLVPSTNPIRGGTDGANLTNAGLPCPNLGTGSAGFHGPMEYSVCEDMDVCVDILEKIVELTRG